MQPPSKGHQADCWSDPQGYWIPYAFLPNDIPPRAGDVRTRSGLRKDIWSVFAYVRAQLPDRSR